MRRKVFLLEDEIELQQIIKNILESFDYKVKAFSSGKKAVEFINNGGKESDIYIIDIQLPNFNGLDILRLIRDNQIKDDKLILVISAYTDIEMIKESYLAGCDDFIKKPFNVQELLLKIQYHYNNDIANIIRLKNGIVYDIFKKELTFFGKEIELTQKELLLVDVLFNSSSKYLNHQDIEEYVYNGESTNPEAIRALVSRVRKKLGNDILLNKSGFGYYISKDEIFVKIDNL